MTRARSALVSVADTPYYHCVGRCVRRAYLCGEDPDTGRSFEHRRVWMERRLALLTEVFSLDLCTYALMPNHYHLVVRLRPEVAAGWDDDVVLSRWTRVFTGPRSVQRHLRGHRLGPAERAEVGRCATTWRERLGSLSWFMRCLNEHIARLANAEDGCTGHFWEGRFKSRALLDEAALLTAMAYVDLNPVRAGLAADIPTSDYTGGQARLRAITTGASDAAAHIPSLLPFAGVETGRTADTIPYNVQDYLNLLDESGRVIRDDKSGFIRADTPRLLDLLGLAADEWIKTMSELQARFRLALGAPQRLRGVAARWGGHWLCGVRHARRLYVARAG